MAETSVGVRELKDHLSEYLRRVRAGESIVITDRGQPIARLTPGAASEAAVPGAMREKLLRLVAAGKLRWSGERYTPEEPIRAKPGFSLSELILEDREESSEALLGRLPAEAE